MGRWGIAVCCAGLAVVIPCAPVARAGDPPVEGIPTTAPWWEPTVTGGTAPTADQFHEPGVLYINMDGGQMQSCGGSNYAPDNCSTIMNDEVLPYSGGDAQRAAVVQAMANDVSAYAVQVTDTRPSRETDYDMVMVGNWNPPPDEGGFAGVAPTIDCYNTNRSETAFSLDLGSPATVAKVVGQEAAHVWGLEHVDAAGDLLFPTTGGQADPSFQDVCNQIVVLDGGSISATDSLCTEMHALNCPDQPNHQNSHLDMLMVFGPPSPDLTPPTLEIVEPAEGEELPSGADIALRIVMADNIPPQLFDVYASIDVDAQGDQVGNAGYLGPDLTIPVNGLPDGEHLIRIDIVDQDGNPATDLVNFTIGEVVAGDDAADDGDSGGDGMPGDTDPGDSAQGSGDDDGAGTQAQDESGGDTDPGAASDATDDGCGCRHAPQPMGLLFLLPLLFGRRARSGVARV